MKKVKKLFAVLLILAMACSLLPGIALAAPSDYALTNPFTKDGYTFAGWKCSVDETVYDAGASYPMTAADTTFTAQWTENTLPETATASIVDGYLGGYTLIRSEL